MAGRVTLTPIPFNSGNLSGPNLLPPSGSVGYDTGTGSFTAWSSNNGIQFVNNGQCLVVWVNGATACTANILLGRKVSGQLPPATTYAPALTVSSSGYIPPLSPQDFTQSDSTAFNGTGGPGGAAALAGAIGTAGVGMTCIDFSAITTLGIRVYSLIPVSP